ncbi:neuropilin-1-like [Saccoglossus kowalevskii]|uniref:Neuropilin-1-like n=1 Tax=Saccoglossus kowalevskii TaxID=10224 RepID=A0ABM0MLM4_SACKO|nr:PREDICTED: neuropilin-1-like [Saccoglossus kowalevskii]
MTLNCAYLGTVLLVAALGSTGEATLYLDDHCGETIRVHGDRMYSQSTKNYDNNMDCLVTIQAPYDYQIVTIDFSWVDLFNRGCYDYIEICDTNGTLLNTICANWEPRDIYSSGNFIYIRMVTDDSRVDRGFSLVFTAFHYDYDLACNDTYEFKCSGNDRCIDDSLVCDDKNNCNNAYDEDDCSDASTLRLSVVSFWVPLNALEDTNVEKANISVDHRPLV